MKLLDRIIYRILLKDKHNLEFLLKGILNNDDRFDRLVKAIFRDRKLDMINKLAGHALHDDESFVLLTNRMKESHMSPQRMNAMMDLAKSKFFKHISFSQSGEDLLVRYIFKALGIDTPTYLDIGAYDPFEYSNTALFYFNGSRGVNIEPNPIQYAEFLKYRPEDINLNIGMADQKGELDFYVMEALTLNTFSKEEAERYEREDGHKILRTQRIEVDTIQNVIKDHCGGVFPDFMSLDIEGVDELVLKSINYDGDNKPKVICVETISYSKSGHGVKDTEIIKFIESKGYMLYADTNINSIFVLEKLWRR